MRPFSGEKAAKQKVSKTILEYRNPGFSMTIQTNYYYFPPQRCADNGCTMASMVPSLGVVGGLLVRYYVEALEGTY